MVAALIGLVLLAAALDWSQLRSAGGAVAVRVLASVVAAVLPGVAGAASPSGRRTAW